MATVETPPHVSDRRKSSRLRWMDSIRGMSVLFILVGHAYFFLPDKTHFEWFENVTDFTAPWRLQTLMFLSGMLLARSLNKPLLDFFLGKVYAIAWPLLLWSALEVYRIWGSLDAVLNPALLLKPSYLWYLTYILLFYCLAPLTRPLPRWLIPALGMVAMMAGVHSQAVFFAVFFWSGWWAAQHTDRLNAFTAPKNLVFLGPIAIAMGTWCAISGYDLSRQWYVVLLEMLSVCGLISFSRMFEQTRFIHAMSWYGRHSIVVYITHWVFLAFFFTHLSPLSPLASLNNMTLLATALIFTFTTVTIMCYLDDYPPVTWLFRLPPLHKKIRRHH